MTPNRSKTIDARAAELLQNAGALQCPVPVEKVARYLGLRLERADLGDDVSGVLVVQKGKGTVGFNDLQHPVRQRFTIAHEIGHFVLHHSVRDVFIDKQYVAVYKRDANSSQGEYKYEVEANRFAAALLMPESLVHQVIRAYQFDLGDEVALKALADTFAVSAQAMSIRLAQLNILPFYS
jgi:Zn-dependent peptidase ImmA (M78 family)